jgi:acyl carrier protein
MSIEDKIRKIIAKKLEQPIEEVVPKASLVDDLGADSLRLAELVMSMEDEYDIEISDDDEKKLKTVQDVIDFIKALS